MLALTTHCSATPPSIGRGSVVLPASTPLEADPVEVHIRMFVLDRLVPPGVDLPVYLLVELAWPALVLCTSS